MKAEFGHSCYLGEGNVCYVDLTMFLFGLCSDLMVEWSFCVCVLIYQVDWPHRMLASCEMTCVQQEKSKA